MKYREIKISFRNLVYIWNWFWNEKTKRKMEKLLSLSPSSLSFSSAGLLPWANILLLSPQAQSSPASLLPLSSFPHRPMPQPQPAQQARAFALPPFLPLSGWRSFIHYKGGRIQDPALAAVTFNLQDLVAGRDCWRIKAVGTPWHGWKKKNSNYPDVLDIIDIRRV